MNPLKKFDARSRQVVEAGGLEGDIEFQLRAATPLSASDVGQLKELGCRLYSNIGTVAAGILGADHIIALAELPFVRQIELSKRLYAE
jgi:hypothetical protein